MSLHYYTSVQNRWTVNFTLVQDIHFNGEVGILFLLKTGVFWAKMHINVILCSSITQIVYVNIRKSNEENSEQIFNSLNHNLQLRIALKEV